MYFVDDDAQRDGSAKSMLARAAREAGFTDIAFQYEPIAAALNHETTVDREQLVLVADIGGGTSDFSLVRIGPKLRNKVDRRGDILANHGVHIAGTDFDRHIELACVLPHCGFRARGPAGRDGQPGREVPSRVYFDLATWHLINTVYAPARVADLARMKSFYAEPRHHARLMALVGQRLGHALIGQAEAAKIALAEGARPVLDLGALEPGLQAGFDATRALAAIDADLAKIVAAADHTVALAGLPRERVDALYFTGGSTGLSPLSTRITARFPAADVVRGDRFASVAMGLGVYAQRAFGGAA